MQWAQRHESRGPGDARNRANAQLGRVEDPVGAQPRDWRGIQNFQGRAQPQLILPPRMGRYAWPKLRCYRNLTLTWMNTVIEEVTHNSLGAPSSLAAQAEMSGTTVSPFPVAKMAPARRQSGVPYRPLLLPAARHSGPANPRKPPCPCPGSQGTQRWKEPPKQLPSEAENFATNHAPPSPALEKHQKHVVDQSPPGTWQPRQKVCEDAVHACAKSKRPRNCHPRLLRRREKM